MTANPLPPDSPPRQHDPPAPAPEGTRQHRFVPPPGSTVITLVRHGESEAAHSDRPFPLVDGHGDPALHADGLAQVEALGRRLAADHVAGPPISAIYVTSLRRTAQTAAPLAAAIGVAPVPVPDLREVFLGDWEGGLLRHKGDDPAFARMMAEERWDAVPGAEPLEQFTERIRRGVSGIAAAHPDQRVVSVSHGGVIGHILHLATGSSRFAFVGANNASISEIVVTGDRWIIRGFNDTSHLS